MNASLLARCLFVVQSKVDRRAELIDGRFVVNGYAVAYLELDSFRNTVYIYDQTGDSDRFIGSFRV